MDKKEDIKLNHLTIMSDGSLQLGLTKPFVQKGRSFINIKDDDTFEDIDRFEWTNIKEISKEELKELKKTGCIGTYIGVPVTNFQLYLDTEDGFRFVEENENGDTFLLEAGDTDCHLYFHWDEIENDIKNMELHLLPVSQLEIVENVDFLLPEREFVWGDGYVLTVHPVWIADKREVLSEKEE